MVTEARRPLFSIVQLERSEALVPAGRGSVTSQHRVYLGFGGKRQRGPTVLQLLLSSLLLFPHPFLDVVIAKIGKGHLSDPYMCLSHTQSYKELAPIQPAREKASKCQDGILASQLDVPSSRRHCLCHWVSRWRCQESLCGVANTGKLQRRSKMEALTPGIRR